MNNKDFTLIDVLSILSFFIGLENLDMNITQTDLQEETSRLDKRVDDKVNKALSEIHSHLEMQDKKIDELLLSIRRLENENH